MQSDLTVKPLKDFSKNFQASEVYRRFRSSSCLTNADDFEGVRISCTLQVILISSDMKS